MFDKTPTFLIVLFALNVGILFSKKERMVVPLILTMCFLPADLSIRIGGLNFYALRIIAITGLIKIFLNGDHRNIQLNKIDRLFFQYIILGSIFYVIASQDILGAFIYKGGQFVDSIILYIVLKSAIYTKSSIRLIVKTFSFCVLAILPFVIFEFFSANNLFSILGRSAVSMRGGEIRAAATFSHAILFGSFAAALFPVLWAEYKIQRSTFNLLAIFSCLFFVYASSSSGPIVAVIAVFSFLFFFQWRQYSRHLAWFILSIATLIHFIRDKPIWNFIYVRVSVKASSTGWHRYLITDAAIKEFWNWWLIGYGDLGPQWHTKPSLRIDSFFTDMTNHYLLEGVRGGFLTMVLFMMLCYKVIKTLGTFSISQHDIEDQWLWWGFTVMMIAHCISFLSVAYFGQITMMLYLTIAVASFTYNEMNHAIE